MSESLIRELNIETLGLIGISSLMLTMLFMPVVIRLALAANVVDLPDERKIHTDEVPSLGGSAIACAFAISCLLFLKVDTLFIAFMSGLLIITLTGVADDIWHLRPALKFTGEIAASLVFILYGGTELKGFGDLIGIGPLDTGIFAVPITVFCMIGVMNALNMSDGLDGLAGGISAIACVFLIYFSLRSGHWFNLALSVSLFGCLIGFLYFNTHPARIFMGDTGSLVLGYILSSICVLSQKLEGDMPVLPISMALILALPIADTLWVMTKRVFSGASPFLADNTHLHHKLLTLNISHSGVVSVLYGCMFICGSLAVFMQSMLEWIQFATGTGFFILLFAALALSQRGGLKFPDQKIPDDVKEHRDDFMHILSATMGKSVSIATWLVPFSLVIPASFLALRGSNFSVVPILTGTIIAALYPWKSHYARPGWVHGLIYIATFMILLFLNLSGLSGTSESSWINDYLLLVSCLILIWVVVKLVFMQHLKIFLISSFELLMIATTWFIPIIFTKVIDYKEEFMDVLILSCLESLVFLLAMKILIREESGRNLILVICLLFSFVIIGLGSVLN